MSLGRLGSLMRIESLYARRLWQPLTIYLVLPLVLMAFLQHAILIFLGHLGYENVNGSELAVPAQTILFAFMFTEHIGIWIFSEHTWGTWNRVRATPASTAEVLTAKALYWGLYLLGQCAFLLLCGVAIFGLTVDGSLLALAAVMGMTVLTAVAFGFCGLALCGSQAAFDAWTYGGALLMAAIGGAITPQELLPSWADTLSPASPIHWCVQGTTRVILDGGGFGAIARPCLMLAAFTVGFLLVGLWRFDPAARKVGRTK